LRKIEISPLIILDAFASMPAVSGRLLPRVAPRPDCQGAIRQNRDAANQAATMA